ncbi:uncharacterized [Tachysurus ichikawai]
METNSCIPVPSSALEHLLEGCVGIGLPQDPRDPTQISRERAVSPLPRAGVGGSGRSAGPGGIWRVA